MTDKAAQTTDSAEESIEQLKERLEQARRKRREADVDGTQRAFQQVASRFVQSGLEWREEQNPRIPWQTFPPSNWNEFCRCLQRALASLIQQGNNGDLVRNILQDMIEFAQSKPGGDPVTHTVELLGGLLSEEYRSLLKPLLPPGRETLISQARQQWEDKQQSAEEDRQRMDTMSY